MDREPNTLADFRRQVTHLRTAEDTRWDASRKLVDASHIRRTLDQLAIAVQQSSLPAPLKETVVRALGRGFAGRIEDLPGEQLKELTGFPPTKAVRALCVLFGLVDRTIPSFPVSQLTSIEAEQFAQGHRNPFDLLLEADVASVLDLGAGDLSFAAELTDHYGPPLEARHKELILHCVDRLAPGSKLGGPLHPDAARLSQLRARAGAQFRFYGNRDMFDLDQLDRAGSLAPRYTIATCWAPATPTFAYEPTRLSQELIHEDLRRTKGAFWKTRVSGEHALEVQYSGRSLLFPPWKFEIRGPLALLDLLSRRGLLCVLGAVDGQVFWEILSQLLADARFRPANQILVPSMLPSLFGEVYQRLSRLPIGGSLHLADVAEIRADLPHVLDQSVGYTSLYRFRHVEIRRGATFENIPASSTARMFRNMVEEAPPWFLILVPDRAAKSAE